MIIREKICNNISVITLQGNLDASTSSILKTFKPAAAATHSLLFWISQGLIFSTAAALVQ